MASIQYAMSALRTITVDGKTVLAQAPVSEPVSVAYQSTIAHDALRHLLSESVVGNTPQPTPSPSNAFYFN